MVPSTAPVIVHCSLSNSDFANRLQQKGHRLRYGTGTTQGSVIFPHGGPVFLIQQLHKVLEEWPPRPESSVLSDVTARLTKSLEVHSNVYLVTISPLLGSNELNAIAMLQEVLPDLRIIPTKDGRECADAMCNIVKVGGPETKKIIEERLETSVEEMKDNTFQDVVKSLPFGESEKEELSMRFKCIADLVNAKESDLEELINPQSILNFFAEDKVTV